MRNEEIFMIACDVIGKRCVNNMYMYIYVCVYTMCIYVWIYIYIF